MRCSSRSTSVSAVRVDLVEAPQVAGRARAPRLSIAVAAQILEQIVVRVHAVERRVASDASRGGSRAGRRRNAAAVRKRAWLPQQVERTDRPSCRRPRSVNGTIRPAFHARHAVRGRHADRQPRRHHGPGAAGPARGRVIAAEDTRRTAHLLARYAIATPTTSLHEHNEAAESGGARRAAASAARTSRSSRTPARRRFRIRAAADSRGHRGRRSRRADSRAERGPGGAGGVRVADATRSRFWDFPRLGQKTEQRGSSELERPRPNRRLLRGAASDSSKRLSELLQMLWVTAEIVVGRELTKAHEELVRGPISDVLGTAWCAAWRVYGRR